MKKAWAFGLLLCVCSIPIAETQQEKTTILWESGNAFLSVCGHYFDDVQEKSRFETGVCLGYISGVNAGVQAAYGLSDQQTPFYCEPEEVTVGQVMRIVIKFVQEHPEKAHFETRELELLALQEAFPCAANTKKK